MPGYIMRGSARFMNLTKYDRGQGLVEYAVILLLVAIVVIVAVKGIGSNTNDLYSSFNSALPNR